MCRGGGKGSGGEGKKAREAKIKTFSCWGDVNHRQVLDLAINYYPDEGKTITN